MKDLYTAIRDLAKSVRIQNLFLAAKELHTIRLFKNSHDLSNLQQYYLSLIYTYDSLYKDIAMENVSKKIIDNDLYADCYAIWKKEKGHKQTDNQKVAGKDVRLVPATNIKFKK